MNTVSTKTQQMPEFLCQTPSIRHDPVIEHDPYQSLIAIYLLRLAIGLKNRLPASALEELFEGDLGELTGLATGKRSSRVITDLDDMLDDDHAFRMRRSRSATTLNKHIRSRLNQVLTLGMQIDTPLFTNVKWLAAELNLCDCEQEILVLSLLMAGNRQFNTYISTYCEWNQEVTVLDYLRIMTTRPIDELKECLDPASTLCRIGWLDAAEKLDVSCLVVPPLLLYSLFEKIPSRENLLKLLLKPVKPTALQANAYPLLRNDLEVLVPYLHTALQRKQSGINVLIYGASSPSKWELARLLAKCVEAQLYEITETGPSDQQWEPQDRFAACQFSLEWLKQHNPSALLVIDAAEGVLPQRAIESFLIEEVPNSGIDLALMKRKMADNPLPVIWIINKPKTIDPAILRIFDYALEVEKMPEALRHKRIAKATRSLSVGKDWHRQLTNADIPLNQIEKAAAIAALSQSDTGLSAEQIMEQVMNSHARLFNRPEAIHRHRPVTAYDLRFTNTSVPLADLVTGLQHHPQGNFCFYGAPGTGKTAFAKHLAERLGLPILIKRASDIFSKWAGESEKNLAKMFREAKRDGAILLLDEADTFLADRRDARHNWELAQVNELLTQMEQFDGIFICTTNLVERLDTASLRRFDFKVKFDYLCAEQRWDLYAQECQRLGAELPEDEQTLHTLKQKIQRLTKLTPGDFAVLARQARFRKEPLLLSEMLDILEQECVAKGENFSKIGFVQ